MRGDEGKKLLLWIQSKKQINFIFLLGSAMGGGEASKKVCVIWSWWCSILLKCFNVPPRLKIDICKKFVLFSRNDQNFLRTHENEKQKLKTTVTSKKHLPLMLIKCAIFLNPRFIIFLLRILWKNYFFFDLQFFF